MFRTISRHIDSSLEPFDRTELDKMLLAELIEFCQERGLPTEGTKTDLIEGLWSWKQNTRPVPAPSAPRLFTAVDDLGMIPTEQQRQDLTSKEFSALFLDGSPGLDIPYSDLHIGDKLGSGGFKDCYRGTYKGEPVAIGELRLAQFSEVDLQEVKHEIKVLKQLRHENVIRFIGVCTHPQHLCIITELCTKGDLFDVIRRYKKPNFAQQVMYMYDIALGVSYLHTRRPSIIHRDLKSMNILISEDDRAKVNDFGLARIRPKANALMHTQCGTPNWQAPEFWSSNPSYTEKVDVYACGLIFWEILTWGEHGYPYHDLSEHALYVKVKEHDARPPLAKLIHFYPRNLLILITEMWEGDPRLRPSMNHVVDRLQTYLS
ncbi:kinase-like domain-containing protein [Syncephalastrum racemosum]|uniref:Kinase-like domain-containing protein n=1 Tax=Syncephalastrum racemosum TaxID=13706 RepID=A0A1X2HT03_SYNRA|nr:kinase-like domain-containing protein [Syncephalastrum racemosum]